MKHQQINPKNIIAPEEIETNYDGPDWLGAASVALIYIAVGFAVAWLILQ